MNKQEILKEIEKHLNGIDKDILHCSYSINLTIKNDKKEYLNDVITISKNFHSNLLCASPYVNTVI